KFLMGLSFSSGLVLVMVAGAELFTGSTMGISAFVQKKINLRQLLSYWLQVYFGNFVGSLLLVALMFWSKQYLVGNMAVAEAALKIASGKLSLDFSTAFFSGILCNILVCLGVWLAYSARNTSDRILAILVPITAFVALGFEHSVANMYLVPMGIVIKTWATGIDLTKFHPELLTWSNFVIKNLIPVTLGNIVGGSFIWLIYQYLYGEKTVKLTNKDGEKQ
ncbi:MAG TPA: formate/nitrite transporter family protein, partial [Candidatus Gracilibacteria bacterium]|nr:formate/nitrite transporter family protein [Candidatus Gracilibacteria bacterium]